MKTAVKNGAKAITRPLKKVKRALSIRSQASTVNDTEEPTVVDSDSTDIDMQSRAVTPELTDGELDPEKELSMSYFIYTRILLLTTIQSDALKKTWRSPIYSFFKSDISIETFEGRPCHFFPCAARKCRTTLGGVRRFQDSKDKASTANLRHHAIRCFGEDAVKNATNPRDIESQNGSIFASFARQGQEPVQYSHRSHSNPEIRYVTSFTFTEDILMYFTSARVVKWVTENNRPANIVNDPELRNLLSAGRPHISIPSPSTVSRDINASFLKCRERVAKLLHVMPFTCILCNLIELMQTFRSTPDVCTSQPMLGRHPTTMHL